MLFHILLNLSFFWQEIYIHFGIKRIKESISIIRFLAKKFFELTFIRIPSLDSNNNKKSFAMPKLTSEIALHDNF
jgi:hypothetical protein